MQHCRIWKRHARLKITQFINSKLPSLVYELARPFTAHRLSPTPGYQCWGKQIFTLSRLAMNRTLKEWWSEQWTNHRIVKIATNCLSKLHSRSKFPSKMKGCCKKGWPAGIEILLISFIGCRWYHTCSYDFIFDGEIPYFLVIWHSMVEGLW